MNSLLQSLNPSDVKVLTKEFPKEKLGVKVQSLSRDKSQAMLVLYLQHTDVMDRLEEVDPAWTAEALEVKQIGEVFFVRMKLLVRGVSRENVGEGNDPKGAYSDALKRCAMLFGVGRWLYDSVTVWVPYNESRDKYRAWTYEDYERALKPNLVAPKPTLVAPVSSHQTVGGAVDWKKTKTPSEAQLKRLFAISKESGWTQADLKRHLLTEYKLESTKDLNLEQYDQFCEFMKSTSPPPFDFDGPYGDDQAL